MTKTQLKQKAGEPRYEISKAFRWNVCQSLAKYIYRSTLSDEELESFYNATINQLKNNY